MKRFSTSRLGINRSMPESTIIPELLYEDVSLAVAWLCGVFGFTERLRIGNHRSQLVLGDGAVVVSEGAERNPESEMSHALLVRVEDVDGHYEHALATGAQILHTPTTYPYGERQYTVRDIGGHVWTFSQSIADVDPQEWGGQVFL